LLSRLVETGGQGLRVRRLGGDRAGEIRLTRFLRNEAVTPEAMVGAAAVQTARRCAGRRVLAIQDSTVVRSQGGGGLYLHPVLAVDAESGAILGLAEARFLSRTKDKRAVRTRRPLADKESQRWLDGAEAAASVCQAAASITVISDREGDIYEAFALRPQGVDLLIRAAQDRALEDEGRLFESLDALPIAARAELDLAPAPGRTARTAKVAVRFMRAKLRRPNNRLTAGLPASVAVTVVDVRETDPPAGAQPLHWRLLTTLAVSDGAAALLIADLYRRRWAIEQLFRTMKAKGFDIEGVLIEAEPPLRRLVMATLVAAVVVQQLVHARDGAIGHGALRPVTDAFEPEDQTLLRALCAKLEGKTERQKNPHPEASLAYAAWVCARLGGWTGYYGKPGPIVMLQGWLRFQAAKDGVSALKDYRDA
jgi:hypothetical protein